MLEPRVSNHGTPLVYLTKRRENSLVYLSNAVEKYCRDTGYAWDGSFLKWASYGFTPDGRLELTEYYPDATRETYAGVGGYVYTVCAHAAVPQSDIPGAFTSALPAKVLACEYVPDAYAAIMTAVREGKIVHVPYEQTGDKFRAWVRETVIAEFAQNADHPEYRYFLHAKFGI